MSNEMYNAARRAVDDVLNTQFVRQGDLAHKKFGNNRNATYRGVIEFSDENFQQVQKRLDDLERAVRETQEEQNKTINWIRHRVDIIWGGLFERYSMSGKEPDLKPGVLPLLEQLAAKYNLK